MNPFKLHTIESAPAGRGLQSQGMGDAGRLCLLQTLAIPSQETESMSEITIYTKKHCAYCIEAKMLLSSRGLPFQEISLEERPELVAEVMARSGQRTVPQIFVGIQSIGGYTELSRNISNGVFEALTQR